MLAHVLGQYTHTDTGEVVDRETSMTRVLCGEETLKAWSKDFISEAGLQSRKTKVLCQVLEENFDEDTAAGCGLLFVEMNHRQDVPTNSIIADQVTKELCDVAKAVRLITVDGIIVFGKRSLEQV